MPRTRIPLGSSFGKGRSGAAGMQALVNCYAEEVIGENMRSNIVIYGSPGSASFSTIGGGSPRGQIRASEGNYAVVGARLYSVSSTGTAVDLGEIEGSDLVDMSYNSTQIDIVAEDKTYSFDVPTGVLSEIVDPNFERACSAASLASYSIYAVKGTGRFRWRLTNATSFSGTDFATAEAESDQLKAVRKAGNFVVLLGSESTEWWYPTGSSGADAFAKASTAAAGIGCVSRDTAILVDNGLTWAGRDGKAGGVAVYRAQGYTPQKISSPQIDTLLEQVADLESLHAFVYQSRGHQFYNLTNPGEWSYDWDVGTNQWQPRKTGSWSMGTDPVGGWDAVTFALNGNKQIIGRADGNLYELQADTQTESGENIVRSCRTPVLYHGGKIAKMSMLELDVETGLGMPTVFMSHSDDNGHTWSSPRAASVGAIGEYRYRCLWPTMGAYRNRVIEFRGEQKVNMLQAWANIAVGSR